MKLRTIGTLALCAALVVSFMVLLPDAAWAGPGGIIKAATHTLFGRIILAILTILLAPVIIYYAVKSAIQVRRTRRDLASLSANLPQYRWLDLKDRVTETFQWVWASWSRQKMDQASQYCTHWYWQNQQLMLDQWAEHGLENVCRLNSITSITPLFVQHSSDNNGEGSRIVVDIKAKVVDYMVEKATGNIVKGDQKEGDLDTVWTFVWNYEAWKLNLI